MKRDDVQDLGQKELSEALMVAKIEDWIKQDAAASLS